MPMCFPCLRRSRMMGGKRRRGGCGIGSARCCGGRSAPAIGPTIRPVRRYRRHYRRTAPLVRRHRRALHHRDVAGALAKIRVSNAWAATKLLLEYTILTATRSGEARLATWSEVNLQAGVWTVPAERMKAGREHRVPVSTRALELKHRSCRRALAFCFRRRPVRR